MRRAIRTAAVLSLTLAALLASSSAHAITFRSAPAHSQTGAGPFTWTITDFLAVPRSTYYEYGFSGGENAEQPTDGMCGGVRSQSATSDVNSRELSYEVPNLPLGRHHFRFYYLNNITMNGNCYFSAFPLTDTVFVDNDPPALPQPSAVVNQSGYATMTAAAVDSISDIEGYKWTLNGVTLGTEATLHYAPGAGNHTFVVTATNSVGLSASASVSVTISAPIPKDTSAPAAPRNLKANSGIGRISLTWSGSSDDVGVTSYVVYRLSGSEWLEISRPTATSFVATGLRPGFHAFGITALDAAGNESVGSPPVGAYARDAAAPTPARRVRVSSSSRSSITYVWNAAYDRSGVWGYEVQVRVGGAWRGRGYPRGLRIVVRGLRRNVSYPMRIRAIDKTSNVSTWVTIPSRTLR